jgi:hypothetical protein
MTHLLHSEHQIVYLARFLCKLPSIANWNGSCDITSVILPFASSINQQDLRFESIAMRRISLTTTSSLQGALRE